jgi:hypothetical protein
MQAGAATGRACRIFEGMTLWNGGTSRIAAAPAGVVSGCGLNLDRLETSSHV